jgi:hypothetical protein
MQAIRGGFDDRGCPGGREPSPVDSDHFIGLKPAAMVGWIHFPSFPDKIRAQRYSKLITLSTI